MRRIMVLAFVALLAASLATYADFPDEPTRVVVYPIADLMQEAQPATPMTRDSSDRGLRLVRYAATSTSFEKVLIDYIQRQLLPEAWGPEAPGLEYYPIGQALVVRGTPRVHRQVARLLERLRSNREPQYQFQIVVVTISQEFLARFGLDDDLSLDTQRCRPPCAANQAAAGCCPRNEADDDAEGTGEPEFRTIKLDEAQVQTLWAAAAGDPNCRTITAPTLMTRPGVWAQTELKGHRQFLTGLTIRTTEDRPAVIPEVTEVATGLVLRVCGRSVESGESIQLRFQGHYTYEDRPPTWFPIQLMMPATDGPDSVQVQTLAHMLQRPSSSTLEAVGEVTMNPGETVLVYGGPIDRCEIVERRPAWLSKVPFLDRMVRLPPVMRRRQEHLLYFIKGEIVPPATLTRSERVSEHGVCVGECARREALAAGETCSSATGEQPHPSTPQEGAVVQASRAGAMNHQSFAPARLTAAIDQRRIERVAAQLVAKYHAACHAGDHEAAREFAQMALDLDPACFSKPFATQMPPVSCPTLVPAAPNPIAPASAEVPAEPSPRRPPSGSHHLPSSYRSSPAADPPTVDYFPFPLVPIFQLTDRERGLGSKPSVRPIHRSLSVMEGYRP
jgi:hypothetical protein